MIVHHTCKTVPALVIKQRRTKRIWVKAGVAGINGRTATQQRVSERRTSVVLQRPKHRIGIDLVAGRCKETAAIVAAKVVTKRTDHAGRPENAASVKHGVGKLRYRTGIVDAASAARQSGRVAAKRGVEHVQPRAVESITTGVDGAAKGGPVVAERAVNDLQRCTVFELTFAVDAAAGSGRVAAEGTVEHRQRRLIIEDAAADALIGRVATDCAAAQRQGRMIIIDASSKLGARGRPIGYSQPRDGNVCARGNVKDAAGVVGVHRQRVGAGTADGDAFVNKQFAAGERDCLAVQRRIEINRVAVDCIRKRLA